MAGTRLEQSPRVKPDPRDYPGLNPGDHMDQETFHAIYERMPEDFRAELIGGVVMIPFQATADHGGYDLSVTTWLGVYYANTPGTRALSNATILLGTESEPQPDAVLIIEPNMGGQTSLKESKNRRYCVGPPELVAEVALSSIAYDRYEKYRDYELGGVREYLIVAIHDKRVEWFVARNGRFEPIAPGEDGILRSEVFPGLWLDPAALLREELVSVLATLQRGLNSPEHREFVQALQGRRTP